MNKIIKMQPVVEGDNEIIREETSIIALAEDMLVETRRELDNKSTLSVPIAELATLGAGVSSLLPALRTVTQSATINTSGLYQLANAGVGDVLKTAKNGNQWGALKTATGGSKMAQFQEVGGLSASGTTVMPIDPTIMMMAVALFAIEQKLGNIEEMQKQILSFLEFEKQAEVEADVETLLDIISRYKHNWDNEHFVKSNHKMVCDIKRNARKNILFYKKEVAQILESKQFIVAQMKVNSILRDLQKDFKYYRLSLYTFSMSSLIEIMLSGNYKEENILEQKNDIEKLMMEYRDLFTKCSTYLESMTASSVERNVLKGLGNASDAVGKFIGSIPVVKEGTVDEFLQDRGVKLKENAIGMEKSVVEDFSKLSNPGTRVFVEKMDDMIQIYNHTSKICFDDKKIYLIAG